MKGVVLWVVFGFPDPDRHPLAGATNTNEGALISPRGGESIERLPVLPLRMRQTPR